jgi:tetratricopeptide (TPR) repeat protein
MAASVLLVVAASCSREAEPAAQQDRQASSPAATPEAPGPAPAGLPRIEFVSDLPARTSPAPPAPPAGEPQRDDVEALRAAVAANPEDLGAQRRLAFALYEAGLRAEAVPPMEKVVESAPGPQAYLELGIVYAGASRLAEAERAYRKVLELSPGNARALHNLGNLAMKRAHHARAVDHYRQAIEADPGYMLAYYHLAEALQAVGRTEQAYAGYLTVLEMTPASPADQAVYNDAAYRVAALALSFGDPAQAESVLSQLVRAAPDHPNAHYARGQALLQLGREAEAQQEFDAHMRILSQRGGKEAVASAGGNTP